MSWLTNLFNETMLLRLEVAHYRVGKYLAQQRGDKDAEKYYGAKASSALDKLNSRLANAMVNRT